MKWGDVGRALGKAAPTIAGTLAGPGGAVAGAALAQKLGVDPTPDAVGAALKAQPARKAQIGTDLEPTAAGVALLHAESESHYTFVRRARPTFIYVVAFSMATVTLLTAFIVIFRPEYMNDWTDLIAGWSTIITAILAVVGAMGVGRSYEKSVGKGDPKQSTAPKEAT